MKINNNGNKVNWPLVFGLKQINKYLKVYELKELCSTNNYLRNKLKADLFNSIDFFNHYPDKDKYLWPSNINGEEAINQKAREFLEEFHPINLYVKRFKTAGQFNIYLLSPLISACSHLNHVWLHYLYIPIPTLRNMLENLSSVEILSFSRVHAVEWKDDPLSISDLKLPKSLKTLSIRRCDVVSNEFYEDPMIFDYKLHVHIGYSAKLFLFNASFLPNLESVSLTEYLRPKIDNINEFLSKQRNLKSLRIEGYVINQNTIDTLKNMINFEDLNILDGETFLDEEGSVWPVNNIPIFNQLKKLSSTHLPSYSLLKANLTSFPNLKRLKLKFRIDIIEEFLLRFSLLELTIVVSQRSFDYLPTFNNLKFLEIITNRPVSINLELFTNSKNLKIIKITPGEQMIENINMKKFWEYFNNYEGWKCKISNFSVLCYRI